MALLQPTTCCYIVKEAIYFINNMVCWTGLLCVFYIVNTPVSRTERRVAHISEFSVYYLRDYTLRLWIIILSNDVTVANYVRTRGIAWFDDNVVSIMTRLRAGRCRVQIPARARDFTLLEIVQIVSGSHPASHSMGPRVHGLGVSLTTTHLHTVLKLRMKRTNLHFPCMPSWRVHR
jgi:hypothetical protein